MTLRLCLAAAVLFALCCEARTQPFNDRKHTSAVFGAERNYRIFLPADYDSGSKRYPVVYYFHGHSDRYTLEHYDKGQDTVPKIAGFVAANDVIVVAVDGYVARDYKGFYGGSPWDVGIEGGEYDFGAYFRELTAHIDSTFRTLTDRRHRATSGLSMGGFMSLWLSARYPDLIGSASAFNPGPEFYTGDKGSRILWRPKDHVSSHEHTMVRLICASGDYISQYHEETREAYARSNVDFEYRQDEFHRHWATSIGETLNFHMRAFANSALDNVPESWSYSSAYRHFAVWGYEVEASGDGAALTYLSNVRQAGFRVTTRRWAPDGLRAARSMTIRTAPLYQAGARYGVIDLNLETGATTRSETTADAAGRITLTTTGDGHQISFAGPGTGAEPPVLLPVTSRDVLRLEPGRELQLPIRIYNGRGEAMRGLQVRLESDYPTVEIVSGAADVAELGSGAVHDLSEHLRIRLAAGRGFFAPASLILRLTYDDWHTVSETIPILIAPEGVGSPVAWELLDGRTVTFDVFRQRGNRGGGGAVKRTVTEGRGNGNGILEAGEDATIWVRMDQGMDPFDKNNWYRTKVHAPDGALVEVRDIEEQKQLEWTSAKERTSIVRLGPAAASSGAVPILLENESWSYRYTPDVRYGREPLYQAFQLHSRHLHQLHLKAFTSSRPDKLKQAAPNRSR